MSNKISNKEELLAAIGAHSMYILDQEGYLDNAIYNAYEHGQMFLLEENDGCILLEHRLEFYPMPYQCSVLIMTCIYEIELYNLEPLFELFKIFGYSKILVTNTSSDLISNARRKSNEMLIDRYGFIEVSSWINKRTGNKIIQLEKML